MCGRRQLRYIPHCSHISGENFLWWFTVVCGRRSLGSGGRNRVTREHPGPSPQQLPAHDHVARVWADGRVKVVLRVLWSTHQVMRLHVDHIEPSTRDSSRNILLRTGCATLGGAGTRGADTLRGFLLISSAEGAKSKSEPWSLKAPPVSRGTLQR
jgi:hypothetical protein